MILNKLLIIALLLTAAGSLQAQTDSITANQKNLVGIWHYPEALMLTEITEHTISAYGSKVFDTYKVLSDNKLQIIGGLDGAETAIVEYKLLNDGNTLMIDFIGEKSYAQKINIQPNTNLIGKYVSSNKQDVTEIVYIEILDESNAMVGYYYAPELYPNKYVVLEKQLLLAGNGNYRTFEIEENGLSLNDFGDESNLMFYKTTEDFDPYQFYAEEETETAETEARTTTISVLEGMVELELTKGADFPCIGIRLSDEINGQMGTYIEIKKRNGFFITNAWDGKKYATIDAAIEDELKGIFQRFYDTKKYKKRGEEVWATFVSEGGLQQAIDFAKEIIDDDFLDSPFNEIYG